MKNYQVILLTLMSLNLKAEQTKEPKLEIGKMDVKDFPYYYKYKDDRYGAQPDEAQKEKILLHPICQRLAEKCKTAKGEYNIEKLKAIAWDANEIAYKAPYTLRPFNPSTLEPEVRAHNDQVMALVNCAHVMLLIAEVQQKQKNVNQLLA